MRQGKWFGDAKYMSEGKQDRYPEEVDFTVWDRHHNIIAGGIDSQWTGVYTFGEIEKKARELRREEPGADVVTVTDRRYGSRIYMIE